MTQVIDFRLAVLAMMMFAAGASNAQVVSAKTGSTSETNPNLKTYVIRRDIPDAGKLTPEQLKGISQTSCTVLNEMGPKIEWLHSYVTGNNIYCVYRAEDENAIREHAKRGGFPANEIIEVKTVISPATAELKKEDAKKKL